eukprot:c45860_g1_i1.p2 GENE.c45860_g1_i1~~c45860_g1_i1.p2  ORF type:complete len:550 (-),score=126.94 c45860_g1_i1:147-1796(-)
MEGAEKMHLFSMKKKEIIVLCVAFVAVFAFTVLLGVTGPNVLREYKTTARQQGLDMTTNKTTFVWEIKNLDRLNQQVYMTVEGIPVEPNPYDQKGTINVAVSVYCSKDNGYTFTPMVINQARPRLFICPANRGVCDDNTLMHSPFIDCAAYRIAVTMLDSYKLPWMLDFYFIWNTISYKFTIFELWFRAVFVGLAVCASCGFGYAIRNVKIADWTYEQRWVAVLLIGLILYNNPFVALQVLVAGWFFPFLDIVFFATFFCLLLLFWLCMFDGIRKPHAERDFKWFYVPKLALVGFIWLFFVTLLMWIQTAAVFDTTYASTKDIPGYEFITVLQLLLLLSYIFWLMFVIIRSVAERATSKYSGRIQLLGGISAFVILITVIGLLVNTISTVSNNAAQFLSFFSLYNLYVYVLAIAFMPSLQVRSLTSLHVQAAKTDAESLLKAEASNASMHSHDVALAGFAPRQGSVAAAYAAATTTSSAPVGAGTGIPMRRLGPASVASASATGAGSDDSEDAASSSALTHGAAVPVSTVRVTPAYGAGNPSAPFPELL